MVFNRIITSSLLFSLLIISLSSCIASETVDPATIASETGTTVESTAAPLEDELPEFDFEGYEFNILTWPDNGGEHTDLTADEQTGEVLNDAIYDVSRKVEERFNIKLKETKNSQWHTVANDLKKLVQAGDSTYDLVLLIDRFAMQLAMEGEYFYQMDELPYVDLSKTYWYPDMNNAISIGNTLNFAYGAHNLSIYDYLCFLVYNKEIAENYGIEDIYELVRGGKWTMDKMQGMCKEVTQDLDGDGMYTDSDRYGFVGMIYYMYQDFWHAERIPLIAKDENDLPYFNVPGNDKLFAIFDRIHEYANSGYWFDVYVKPLKKYAESKPTGHEIAMKMFSEGHALFGSSSVYMVQALRGMEADYGIIPYPTYDEKESGEPYYARVPTSILTVVPSTNTNPERASVIQEALASEYYKTVVPVYFSIVTQEKATRDEESWNILNMLDSHRFIDMADTVFLEMEFGRGAYSNFMQKENKFASITESLQDKADKKLAEVIEMFSVLKDN